MPVTYEIDPSRHSVRTLYQLLCEASLPVRIEVFRDLEPTLAWVRAAKSTSN